MASISALIPGRATGTFLFGSVAALNTCETV